MSKLKQILQKLKEIGDSNAELAAKKERVNSEVMPLLNEITSSKEALGFVTILHTLPLHEEQNRLTENILEHSAFRNNISKRDSRYQAEHKESITFKEIDFIRLEQNRFRGYIGEYGNTQTWQELIVKGISKSMEFLKAEYPNGKLPESFYNNCKTIFALPYERYFKWGSAKAMQEFDHAFQSAASAAVSSPPSNTL